MRTLYEIVESAKDGDKPTHDECYWAMLVLSVLNTMGEMDLRSLVKCSSEINSPEVRKYNEYFYRMKKALDQDPKVYLGEAYDPSNEGYQNMRKAAKALLGKVIKEEENG